MSEMTPREIVQELDKHIVGQKDAKRAVAIALRNRWRRMQVGDEDLRREITPKNILMIGPTGIGKTEIARRLARLAKAPFLKVEATKFTEVGYVGREVDSIVRDLVEMAVKMIREEEIEKSKPRAEDAAEDRLLDALLPEARDYGDGEPPERSNGAGRQHLRKLLREGKLNDKEIEIELANGGGAGVEIFSPAGMEDMTNQIQSMMQNFGGQQTSTRKMRVDEALKLLVEEEAAKMVNEDDIKVRAVERAEQDGIVFIDEIDKIVGRSSEGADAVRMYPVKAFSVISCRLLRDQRYRQNMEWSAQTMFFLSRPVHFSSPSLRIWFPNCRDDCPFALSCCH